jgi:hypothetical protein
MGLEKYHVSNEFFTEKLQLGTNQLGTRSCDLIYYAIQMFDYKTWYRFAPCVDGSIPSLATIKTKS